MKRLIATILLLHSLSAFGQDARIKAMVDSLRYLKADTLNCTADLYWRIVAKGKAAIPFLIDKLGDTTPTRIRNHCKATKLNVGEVSYFALDEIAFWPTMVITGIQFDVISNGCWNFYEYLFNNANKRKYQQLVRQWYERNKTKFKPEKIPGRRMTACRKRYHITTFFRWRD